MDSSEDLSVVIATTHRRNDRAVLGLGALSWGKIQIASIFCSGIGRREGGLVLRRKRISTQIPTPGSSRMRVGKGDSELRNLLFSGWSS